MTGRPAMAAGTAKTAEGLAFSARALAQAHPLSRQAKALVDRAVAAERSAQPLPEIGIWAGSGLLVGYCLRRVEEGDAGVVAEPPEVAGWDAGGDRGAILDALEEAADVVGADLRAGQARAWLLGQEERTVAALDLLIASEVAKRLENWRDSVDDRAWAELEEYLTWWVVKGYAVRVAEVASWAGAAAGVPR